MSDNWRTLIYPLGFLSSVVFSARFLVQWIDSEVNKTSRVNRLFWQLSIVGNLLLFIHSIIQVQFHVCAVQACNTVISWRNLNLMGDPKKKVELKTVWFVLAASLAVTAAAFVLQGYYFLDSIDWIRQPKAPWDSSSNQEISFFWHAIGFVGLTLFASRFWVQWWASEKHQRSHLGRSFWILSVIGALLALVYFVRINDTVNLIGPALGMIPYLRNLVLIKRSRQILQQDDSV